MNLRLYQVDAFTSKIFGGNPAAVCPLTTWLSADVMQNIAMENNLAETAFYCPSGNGNFDIRWFTPSVEVDLCGHATLATAHTMFHHEGYTGESIVFNSRSGPLRVNRFNDWLQLDFPTDVIWEVMHNPSFDECFNDKPLRVWKGKTDYLLVFESEEQVRNLQPDFVKIRRIPARGVIATAKGEDVDFVSRFFAPQSGIPEDPVTGSAHTSLVPYWANVLKKDEFEALQVSPRGGYLRCKFQGDRVLISGQAKTYLSGEFFIN